MSLSLSVTTTCGEVFSENDTADLAFMVYRRFGRDIDYAHSAWMRLLGNNCTVRSFENLVNKGALHAVELRNQSYTRP